MYPTFTRSFVWGDTGAAAARPARTTTVNQTPGLRVRLMDASVWSASRSRAGGPDQRRDWTSIQSAQRPISMLNNRVVEHIAGEGKRGLDELSASLYIPRHGGRERWSEPSTSFPSFSPVPRRRRPCRRGGSQRSIHEEETHENGTSGVPGGRHRAGPG